MARPPCVVATLAVVISVAAPAWPGPKWVRLRTPDLVLIGDAGTRDIGRVGVRLGQFRESLSRLLPRAATRSPIPTIILVFDDDRSFEPFKPLHQGKPADVAGVFVPGPYANYIALSLEGGKRAYPIIFHEYVHFVLHSSFSFVPLWFDEGLAEYYASFEFEDKGTRAQVGKPSVGHLLLLRNRGLLDLVSLLTAGRDSPLYIDPRRREVFYAEAWALVHYLVVGNPDRASQLSAFLNQVGAGAPFDRAFRAAFACGPVELEKELRAYVNQRSFRSLVVRFRDRIAAEGAVVEPITDDEASVQLAELLSRVGRRAEARARLELLIRRAPDLAGAYAGLGSILTQEERPDEAVPLLERAVTLAPTEALNHYHLGVALTQRYLKAKEPAFLEAARSAFSRALALQPNHPEALFRLGCVQAARGELAEARSLLASAHEQVPAREAYRLALGEVCLLQGDLVTARKIDILSRLGETFRFAGLESEVVDLDGVPFRTATAGMLYRMKKDTVRPQDRLDAQVSERTLWPGGRVMPVRKFRSVSDMPQAPVCTPLDPANIALACDLSELATRLRPRRFPAGVYRYSSIEAASLARDAWERAGRDGPTASGETTLSA